MAKRTWREASLGEPNEPSVSHHNGGSDTSGLQHAATISRRVKACATCRKQKIKCIMDDRGPPCRRCEEKNLRCVLNKSLQTLINERLPATEALVQDIQTVYGGIQMVLQTLNLPTLTPLHCSTLQSVHTPTSEEPAELRAPDEVGPSCDNSPNITPEDDNDLPKVPIHSLYRLTKLSALRSPETHEVSSAPDISGNAINDFISSGCLSLEDAERLFRLYMDRPDHFIYRVGGRSQTLDEMRRTSRLLTAAVLTVAALHDLQSNAIYGICSKEFRRLMAASIFDRRIDKDYLRAMCVAAYWLSDISWMVSGYAVRRASELNLANQYRRLIAENSEEAADHVRLWYVLYICDQHLSTLYGRQSVMREDFAILGWEAFLRSPVANDEDKRLISQVALLNIIHNIRELFGPDTGDVIPQVYVNQISGFARQLDQWVGHWSLVLQEHHDLIGGFPRKGVLLHFHFAKLHLYSQVFRGIRNSSIPAHFLDAASSAVTAAISIINFITTDPDLQAALVGMPSYLHSMTAFACMFLAKLTMIHGDSLVECARVLDLTSRLIAVYRSTPVGKWHLVHLMASGLEKIASTLQRCNTVVSASSAQATATLEAHNPAAVFSDFENPVSANGSFFNLDPDSLLGYDMSLDASHLMFFRNNPFATSPSNQQFAMH